MSKSIIATNKGGGERLPLLESGTYIARCYSMIDLGTQTETFQGKEKHLRKVRLTWELPNELYDFGEEKGELPRVISKEFTLSMSEKGKLRPFLESWRGKGFTDEEAQGFDVTVLLGVPCMLNISQKKSKNGNDYNFVSGIGKLGKGMTCPQQVNEDFIFVLSPWSEADYKALPDFLKDVIRQSAEWPTIERPNEAPTANEPETETEEDDEPPF